jgi:hypothetical protein
MELYELYGEPDLVTCIKLKRLQWAGHVQRIEFVFCHPCGIIIMILIVPNTFHTHCVRVSIKIRANIIIFFTKYIYIT